MSQFYVGLFHHCILQGGIYSSVPQELLKLLYGHTLVDCHCRKGYACDGHARNDVYCLMALLGEEVTAGYVEGDVHTAISADCRCARCNRVSHQ